MAQSTHAAALKDATSKPKMEEFAGSMEQRSNSAAALAAQIKQGKEESASSMGLRLQMQQRWMHKSSHEWSSVLCSWSNAQTMHP
mmetsp:Transcript_8207/g.13567  ORF Transcript_8207/g.13567 Transcript_8207/m.13567 type:complete len:85 (+) Transcript_8207:723-977(+)